VDDYVDNFLAQQISQVPGVAQATIQGDQKPSIRVQVDPAKLASSGLTLEEVRSALITSTTISAKGTVNTERTSFTIAANDQIIDAVSFNDIVLAYRNGGPIRVRDVGQAISAESDRTIAGYQNGQRGILLYIYKQPGANVIEIVDKVKEMLPRLTERIPPAIDVRVQLDRTTTIRASVEDVEFVLMLTIVLVVLVILLFPAQFLGDVHSRRDGAAGAARLVRFDVSAQFRSSGSPSTATRPPGSEFPHR
jgi:multidrug efflux pump subunit AcrB